VGKGADHASEGKHQQIVGAVTNSDDLVVRDPLSANATAALRDLRRCDEVARGGLLAFWLRIYGPTASKRVLRGTRRRAECTGGYRCAMSERRSAFRSALMIGPSTSPVNAPARQAPHEFRRSE
jgi:hypothetical protein